MNPIVIAPEHPKAALVLVHGMAEHAKRYLPLMRYLSEEGFACVISDLPGHGSAAAGPDELGYLGPKGDKVLVQDTLEAVRFARAQYPGLKLFLLGHSMGSLIVRCLIKQHDNEIDGLIVSGSPSRNGAAGAGIFLTRVIGLFKGRKYRSKMLERLTTGAYQKKFKAEGIGNAWLSVNKANVQAYNNDPLCGYRFTVNGYQGLLKLMKETYSPKGWEVRNPELPVHFIAGSDDPCIGSLGQFAQAVSFLRERGYKRVTSKVYPGMRHEILNEIGKEDIWREVSAILQSWL